MPRLFVEEDLGEAEAAAREFLGIVVTDQCDAFFSHFGAINLPRLFGELFGVVFDALREGGGGALLWGPWLAEVRGFGLG